MADNEIWKEIQGYEGLYQVSSLGRVKSTDRHINTSNNQVRFYAGKILKLGDNGVGHKKIGLHRTGKIVQHYVHRLVAEAFIGPRPPGCEVCHNNGDPSDNVPSNLRYDTPVGNNADKKIHGTLLFGEKHPSRKLRTLDVLRIRSLYDAGFRSDDIAARFGVSRQNINAIGVRRSWKHLPERGAGGNTK